MHKSLVFSSLLYVTSIILTCTQSYVLLAANLDDFKKVAKKFVPEKLALQIAEIATSSSIRKAPKVYKAPNQEKNEDELLSEDTYNIQSQEVVEKSKIDLKEEAQVVKNLEHKYDKENINKLRDIDFEALVQQVKKRIEDDILKKQIKIDLFQRENQKGIRTPDYSQHFKLQKHNEENYNNAPNHKFSTKNLNHLNYTYVHEIPHHQQQQETYNYPPENKVPLRYVNYANYTNNHKNPYLKKKKDDHNYEPLEDLNDEYPDQHYNDKERLQEDTNVEDATYEDDKIYNKYPNIKDKQRHHNYESNEYQTQTEAAKKYKKYREKNHKDKIQQPLVVEEESSLFSKVTMVTNDSYEDYVTPKKEINIYASKETTVKERADKLVYNIKPMEPKFIPLAAKVTNEYEYEKDKSYYNDNPDELKAKTENLWYDDYETNLNVEHRKEEHQTPAVNMAVTSNIKPDKVKGTMMPKRDVFKISSPNYYAKIPVVAEKYDFNEPIPEHDREPEDKRSLPIPPSFINGKVRISH
ncbi:hypothetical protein evm_010880 [Chilo suppressalis]|nr:hypothetical protein evm_010880 [Chilo suppressalis]